MIWHRHPAEVCRVTKWKTRAWKGEERGKDFKWVTCTLLMHIWLKKGSWKYSCFYLRLTYSHASRESTELWLLKGKKNPPWAYSPPPQWALGGLVKLDPKYMVFYHLYLDGQKDCLSGQGAMWVWVRVGPVWLEGQHSWRGGSTAEGAAQLEGRHAGDDAFPQLKPDYLGLHPRHKIDQLDNPGWSLNPFFLSFFVYKIGIRWVWPHRTVVQQNEIIPMTP